MTKEACNVEASLVRRCHFVIPPFIHFVICRLQCGTGSGRTSVFLGWLSAASVLMFFGSLIAVPWLVVRIPADYFLRQRHYVDRWRPRHPLLRLAFLALKNLLGVVLVLAGVAMLVLPGQGILTILVGLLFLDFPGKFALERRLARQPPVLRASTGYAPRPAASHWKCPSPLSRREQALESYGAELVRFVRTMLV